MVKKAETMVAALLVANVVLLVGLTVLRGHSSHSSVYGFIANLTMLVPTLACFARTVVGGPLRAAAVWLALAMLSQTAGNIIYTSWTQF